MQSERCLNLNHSESCRCGASETPKPPEPNEITEVLAEFSSSPTESPYRAMAREIIALRRRSVSVPPTPKDAIQDGPMFPIQDGPDIPWSAIAPYEKYALRNHAQSLRRLAERGGLGVAEAIAVMRREQFEVAYPSVAKLSKNEQIAVLLQLVAEIDEAKRRAPSLPPTETPPDGETVRYRFDKDLRQMVFDPPRSVPSAQPPENAAGAAQEAIQDGMQERISEILALDAEWLETATAEPTQDEGQRDTLSAIVAAFDEWFHRPADSLMDTTAQAFERLLRAIAAARNVVDPAVPQQETAPAYSDQILADDADAARLDWLEANPDNIAGKPAGGWTWLRPNGVTIEHARTLREAIDAARGAARSTGDTPND